MDGGRDRDRTCDPLIKSQLLYRLSYAPDRFGAAFVGAPSSEAPHIAGVFLPRKPECDGSMNCG